MKPLLVSFSQSSPGIEIRRFEEKGISGIIDQIPELTEADHVLSTEDGAVVITGNRFAFLAKDGTVQGKVLTFRDLPDTGAYIQTVLFAGKKFAVAWGNEIESTDENNPYSGKAELHFQIFDLEGQPLIKPVTIPVETDNTQHVGMTALAENKYLIVWVKSLSKKQIKKPKDNYSEITINQISDSIVTTIVTEKGEVSHPPTSVYIVGASSGKIQDCCWISQTADENAVLVWTDDTPGREEVFKMRVSERGPLEPALQISRGRGDKDGTFPQVVFNGEENIVAWIHGTSNAFESGKKGFGRLSVLKLEGQSREVVFEARKPIHYDYSLAVYKNFMGLVARTVDDDYDTVFGDVYNYAATD